MSEAETVKYAMYSATAAYRMSTAIWELEDGQEVEVTAVISNPDSYNFDDAVNYGPVKGYVRAGRERRKSYDIEEISGQSFRGEADPDIIEKFNETLKGLNGKYAFNLKTEGECEEEVTPGPKF